MAEVDDTHKEITLDEERQDAVLIISKDGEILMIEPPFDGPQPDHVATIEGLARALSDPIMYAEIMEIVQRALVTAPEIDFTPAPTLQ